MSDRIEIAPLRIGTRDDDPAFVGLPIFSWFETRARRRGALARLVLRSLERYDARVTLRLRMPLGAPEQGAPLQLEIIDSEAKLGPLMIRDYNIVTAFSLHDEESFRGRPTRYDQTAPSEFERMNRNLILAEFSTLFQGESFIIVSSTVAERIDALRLVGQLNHIFIERRRDWQAAAERTLSRVRDLNRQIDEYNTKREPLEARAAALVAALDAAEFDELRERTDLPAQLADWPTWPARGSFPSFGRFHAVFVELDIVEAELARMRVGTDPLYDELKTLMTDTDPTTKP